MHPIEFVMRNKEQVFTFLHINNDDFVGFYARIMDMDDIHDKIFEYVKVLARPMVLYQHDHPIHWSPGYVGGKVRNLLCVINTSYLLY